MSISPYNITPLGEGVLLALFGFLVLMAIVWFFLPFAIFGIKERMDSQAALSREILAELKALRIDQKAALRHPDTRSSA